MSDSLTVKVESQSPSAIKRELSIEVDADVVGKELQAVLKGLARTARIPGFRPGKAPKSLLRKRFARDIENEVLQKIVPQAIRTAVEETGEPPVHEPVVRDISLVDGEPLRFTAAFEVTPKIELGNYKGVSVDAASGTVADADVDAEIDRLREAHASYVAVEDRTIARGDHAVVDISNDADGEEKEQSGVMIEVGGEEYHPEFANNLEGLSPGDEREFAIAYDEDDPDPQARGRSVQYRVRVNEIKEKVLPEADDDFAQDLGQFDTLAEVKESIREQLQQRLAHQERRQQEQQLAEAITGELEFEVPTALVEREVDRALEDQIRMLAARGIDPQTAPIDWRQTREKLKEPATKSVKWELTLAAIAAEEKIEPTVSEVEERLEAIARGSNKSVAYVRTKIEKDGRLEEVRRSVKLQKTIDFLMDNARMAKR